MSGPVRIVKMGTGTRSYWVGLGKPSDEQVAADDYTCPEVTHHYVTKSTLRAAVETGEAWIDGNNEYQ